MRDILIFKMWRYKLSVLAVFGTAVFIFLWPSLPLGGVMKWFTFFYYYTPQNYFYAAMAILSGLYVGAFLYNRNVVRCCSIKDAKSGTTGSLAGILLGACPACIPALAFLFPLSITIVLSRLSLIFLVLSIAIMLFSIWKIGGFQKI